MLAPPLSITLAVNCHLASNMDFFIFFYYTDRLVRKILHKWIRPVCLHQDQAGYPLCLFPSVSLSQPGKVENWLQVIWRRSYLLLTLEWHHNGAAGVQLPFSPPPSVLPSAFTSAFADKLRLMTEISREPAYLLISHGHVECERPHEYSEVSLITWCYVLTPVLPWVLPFPWWILNFK